jgi:hypothetical protein
MITIDYTHDDCKITYSDAHSEPFAREIAKATNNGNSDYNFTTCNENDVHAFRLLIAEGSLPHDKVRFLFGDQTVNINEYGACRDWPDGWADTGARLAENILCATIRKKKQNDKVQKLHPKRNVLA